MPKGRLVFDGDNIYTEKQARIYKLKQDISDKIDGIPGVIDNLNSTSTTDALSANMGRELQDQINALSGNFHFLSAWNCVTGLPGTNPAEDPYVYQSGDYYIVSTVAGTGGTNYKPHGGSYTQGVPSTDVEVGTVNVNDWYIYDGAVWVLQPAGGQTIAVDTQMDATSTNPVENRVITQALAGKQNIISDLSDIRDGAAAGITALQSGDNVTELVNNAGYQTAGEVNSAISAAIYRGTTAPANPTEGQLWYDTTNDVLKAYDGTQWVAVSGGGGATYTAGTGINIDSNNVISNTQLGPTVSATAPQSPSEGDLWYDTTNDVLKSYDGTNWNEIGSGGQNTNMQTFYLAGNQDTTTALAIGNYYISGGNPLIMYKNHVCTLQAAFNGRDDDFLRMYFQCVPFVNQADNGAVGDYETRKRGDVARIFLDFRHITYDAQHNPTAIGYVHEILIETGDSYSNFVKIDNAQTITGAKTFSISPVVPSKTSAATNTGTAVATEAQVYNVASNVNTKTFTLPYDLSSAAAVAVAQEALDWYKAGGNPILYHLGGYDQVPMPRTYYLSYADMPGSSNLLELVFVSQESHVDEQNYEWRSYDDLNFFRIHLLTNSSTTLADATTVTAVSEDRVTGTSFYVNLRGAQTISGAKTFTTSPIVPNKTTDVTNTGTAIATEAQVYSVDNKTTKVSATAPSSPTEGMLRYDTTNDVLKSYDGTNWNECGGGTTYTAGDGISIDNICHSDMQGPCPDGYHVPLSSELRAVLDAGNTLGAWTKDVRNDAYGTDAYTYLHIPMCGYIMDEGRYYGPDLIPLSALWCSDTAQNSAPYSTWGIQNSIALRTGIIPMGYGINIRPFKDTVVVPDAQSQDWTQTYVGTGGAGIWHNATEGIISISADGTNWYTLSDKNLGATVVYNSGDTVDVTNGGNLYQWGNCQEFPLETITNTIAGPIDPTGYGPGNYYSSDFIVATDGNIRSPVNTNMWGGVSQGSICEEVISSTATGGIISSNNTYNNIIHLSQAEYDSLVDRDPNTLYSTPEGISTTAKYGLEKEYDAIVDAAGNGDYTTIGAAVDAGKRKIFVKDGTYNETQGHFVTLGTSGKLVIIGESQTGVVVNISLTEVQTQWSEYRNYPAFLFVDAQNTTDAEVEIKKMTVNASINTTVTIASFLKLRTDDGGTTDPNILSFYVEDCKFYAENVGTSYAAFNIVTRTGQSAFGTNDIYNCIITVTATNGGLRYGGAEEVVREENCIYKNCNFIAKTSNNALTIGFNVLNAFDCSFNANSDMCTGKLSVDIENADNCDIYFGQCVNRFDMLFINIRNSTISLGHYGDYTRDRIPTNTIIPYWQGSTAYALGDMVIYNGRLYKCNAAHTSNADTSWDSEEYDKRDSTEVRLRDIYGCHIGGGHTLFEFGGKVSNNEISFLGTGGDVFFDEGTMFNSNEFILGGGNAYMNSRTIFKGNNLSNYSGDVYYNNSKNNIITNNISWATNIFKAVGTGGTSVVNDNIAYS